MKIKNIITIALLLFVALSIVTLFKKEAASEKPLIIDSNTKAIVYYFHGNMRCKKCKTIETLSQKAIKEKFPKKLENKEMVFQVVNVEKPSNEHFVKEYELSTRTVVVSLLDNGVESNWKRLDRVWDLTGDEQAFIKYVQDETRSFMEDAN